MEMHDNDRQNRKAFLQRAKDTGQHVREEVAMAYGIQRKHQSDHRELDTRDSIVESGARLLSPVTENETAITPGESEEVHIVTDTEQAEALRELMEAEGKRPTIINTQDDDDALEQEAAKEALKRAREVTVWSKNEPSKVQQESTDRKAHQLANSAYGMNKNIQVAKPPTEHRDLHAWKQAKKESLEHQTTANRSMR